MANVDKFERVFHQSIGSALVKDERAVQSGLDMLDVIEDVNRPKLFKGASREDIVRRVCETVSAIRENSVGDADISRSDCHDEANGAYLVDNSSDNRKGSDVDIVEENGKCDSFELKLGAATDVAAGVKVVNENLIPRPSDIEALLGNVVERRTLWKSGRQDIAKEQQKLALVAAETANSAYMGELVSERGRKILNNYRCGITSSEEIFSSTSPRKVTRLTLTKSGIEVSSHEYEDFDDWKLANIVRTKSNRLNVFFASKKADTVIKLTLNWKNSYRFADGEKVAARFGLGSASYNGWIKIHPSKRFAKYIA